MKDLEQLREKLDHVIRNNLTVQQYHCRKCGELRKELYKFIGELDDDITRILQQDNGSEGDGTV